MMTNRDQPDGPWADEPAAAETPRGAEPAESFEEALAALGDIVTRLESGSLGLSASIGEYERGVRLIRRLQAELTSVERRVSLLIRVDDEGRPVLAEFDPPVDGGGAAGSAQPAKRSARRPRTRRLPGMDDAAEEA